MMFYILYTYIFVKYIYNRVGLKLAMQGAM